MFRKKKPIARQRPGAGAAPSLQPNTPSVFSFHSSRSNASSNLGRGKTPQGNPNRPKTGSKRWFKSTVRLIAALALAAVMVSNLLLNGEPEVVIIDGQSKSRATYRDAEVYQAAATQAFSSSVFNTNKLTADTGRIEATLKQRFPELTDVTVSLPFIGHKPVVYLQHSAARLVLAASDRKAYVLDGSGKAIATGDALVRSLQDAGLPTVQDRSTLDLRLGRAALPSTTVGFITEVVRQLNAKDVDIASLELASDPSELHVHVTGVEYYIKFNTRGDARVEAGAYLALKQYLEAQHQMPAEYIDVRVENRVYYK